MLQELKNLLRQLVKDNQPLITGRQQNLGEWTFQLNSGNIASIKQRKNPKDRPFCAIYKEKKQIYICTVPLFDFNSIGAATRTMIDVIRNLTK